jgi:2-polyprenyl-6-methoxyphenol hydroxylase-like FAD-dependent oxidoreductase
VSGLYDIITVGGGLGGSTLARAMAQHGARVLVVEKEERFRDRVRGEIMPPWGVAELKELGVYELLRTTSAREMLWFDIYIGPMRVAHRDLIEGTLPHLPGFNSPHPQMQQVLLQAAVDAGAEARRSARVCDLKPGRVPTVTVRQDGRVEDLQARLVVCADGRASAARKWGGFKMDRDLNGTIIAGVLLDEMRAIEADTNCLILNPVFGQAAIFGPQGASRVRVYATYPRERPYRLQGGGDLPRLVEESVRASVPAEWYTGVKTAGPLASFDGTDTWVEHPYREGVVLIGDAAACSDPSYGQGQSLTFRDARVLRDCLVSHADWDEAGHAYAAEHDRYYGALHRATQWFWSLFYDTRPGAEALRARAFPLIAEDVSRIPDFLLSGPEVPLDETARRRFFGEE